MTNLFISLFVIAVLLNNYTYINKIIEFFKGKDIDEKYRKFKTKLEKNEYSNFVFGLLLLGKVYGLWFFFSFVENTMLTIAYVLFSFIDLYKIQLFFVNKKFDIKKIKKLYFLSLPKIVVMNIATVSVLGGLI